MADVCFGGCACGRVRYTAAVTSFDAYLCHCRMCQRATGGVAAAFVGLAENALTWLTEPDWYASSPIARRPFCARCGTPLGFEYLDGSGSDVTVGSLDDPTAFTPCEHAGCERLIEGWIDTSALPRHPTTASVGTVARWRAVGRDVPD